MSEKAVVLLSGGLDSRLAVRIMQNQGLEVEALNFRTIFTCCQDNAAQAARDLGVPLTVIGQQDDYLDVIRRPSFGYGQGANPCVDCRIYMFRIAKKFMQDIGACVVVSGEVLGQRPMSQKRRDLGIISHHSGLEDLLLRPLSAKRLAPTLPERDGIIDREKLYDFWGRGRKPLIALAREFGFSEEQTPSPSSGCSLTEKGTARRVHDLIQLNPENTRWDFQLLKIGRHFRIDNQTKCIVGRREEENHELEYLFSQSHETESAMMRPHNFAGPVILIVGGSKDDAMRPSVVEFATGLMLRYANNPADKPDQVKFSHNGQELIIPVVANEPATSAVMI